MGCLDERGSAGGREVNKINKNNEKGEKRKEKKGRKEWIFANQNATGGRCA